MHPPPPHTYGFICEMLVNEFEDFNINIVYQILKRLCDNKEQIV